MRPLGESAFRKDIHPVFRQLIGKLIDVDELRRPSIGELLKDPLVDALREMVKPKDENGKKKFSFNDKITQLGIFYKKKQAK